MPVPIRAAALIAAAVFNATSLHAAPADSPLGVWLDHTGRGAVEIKPCGDKLCGHVVWVKSTGDAKGCGRQIIGDAVAGGKVVHSGWIYSPEKRKRYNVELSPMADGRLKVLGYAGTKLFSKTMYWTPAAASLTRCDGTTTAAAPAAAFATAGLAGTAFSGAAFVGTGLVGTGLVGTGFAGLAFAAGLVSALGGVTRATRLSSLLGAAFGRHAAAALHNRQLGGGGQGILCTAP